MTPAAQLAAAIELIGAIGDGARPADLVAGDFFRARRYIGAKDRRAVSDLVYGVIRRRAALRWWLDRIGADEIALPRGLVIAALALVEGWRADRIDRAFDGGRYHPDSLNAPERALARALDGHSLDHPRQPDWVRCEVPEWLYGKLAAVFGAGLVRELAALAEEAPVDLRVNSLKATPEEAKAALAAEGLAAEPTPLSPLGLRLERRVSMVANRAFRDGLVEIQDEGSQLVALLVQAKPGQRVCDVCAGAGGKTLALAASMANRGQIMALDVRAGRIARAAQRLRRAGVHNVTTRQITGPRDPWIKRHKAGFDRVLVDAPCTGCGTWRRNPDAKWRLKDKDLLELVELQREILASAARLVRPGGRLVYATCSLLPEENEDQAIRFLADHPDFRTVPVPAIWAESLGGACPVAGPYLMLTPARHGTDGFFAAVFERG